MREHKVDAVVLDYKMPGMNGADVAEWLRRDHADLPIILLTGMTPEVPEILLRTVDAHIRKGEPPEVLLSAIAEVLSRRERKSAKGTRATGERGQHSQHIG